MSGHSSSRSRPFWRRSLWERIGATIDNSSIAGDFELWARLFATARPHAVDVPLSGFRVHGDQISVQRQQEYLASSEAVLERHGGRRAGLMHSAPICRWHDDHWQRVDDYVF